jgi:hypothetical protein
MVNGEPHMMNGQQTIDGHSSFNNIPLNSSTLKHNSIATPQPYTQSSQTLPRRPHSVAQAQQNHSFRQKGNSGASTPNRSATNMTLKKQQNQNEQSQQLQKLVNLLKKHQNNANQCASAIQQIGLHFDNVQVSLGREQLIVLTNELNIIDILQRNITSWMNHPDLALYSWQLYVRVLVSPQNRVLTINTFLHDFLQTCRRRETSDLQDWSALAMDAITGEQNEACINQCTRMGVIEILVENVRQCIGQNALNTDNSGKLLSLRHSVIALCNISLFGSSMAQKHLVVKDVVEWLYAVLIGTEDEITKFYAMLCAGVLASNKSVCARVASTGILNLFESNCLIIDAAAMDKNLADQHDCRYSTYPPRSQNCQNSVYLERISRLFMTKEPAAPATTCIGALAMAVEICGLERVGVPKDQIKRKLGDVNTILSIKRVAAMSDSHAAKKHAVRALKIANEPIPKRLVKNVCFWDVDDVLNWVMLVGFRNFSDNFKKSAVNGELLLQLDEDNLLEDINIGNSFHRKRFLADLTDLKVSAEYSGKGVSEIGEFLKTVGEKYVQYTYNLVNAGVNVEFLEHLTDDQLKIDCKVANGVHRGQILRVAEGFEPKKQNYRKDKIPRRMSYSIDDSLPDIWVTFRNPDGLGVAGVFRALFRTRSDGVVKMNIDRLDTSEYTSFIYGQIEQCSSMFVILTPGSLDHIVNGYRSLGGGTEQLNQDEPVTPVLHHDWFEMEISTAFENKMRVVPIRLPGFKWPEPNQLPPHIRPLCGMKGLKWQQFDQDGASTDHQDRFADYCMKFLNNNCNEDTASIYTTPGDRRYGTQSRASMASRHSIATSDKTVTSQTINLVNNPIRSQASSVQSNSLTPRAYKSRSTNASHISLPNSYANSHASRASTYKPPPPNPKPAKSPKPQTLPERLQENNRTHNYSENSNISGVFTDNSVGTAPVYMGEGKNSGVYQDSVNELKDDQTDELAEQEELLKNELAELQVQTSQANQDLNGSTNTCSSGNSLPAPTTQAPQRPTEVASAILSSTRTSISETSTTPSVPSVIENKTEVRLNEATQYIDTYQVHQTENHQTETHQNEAQEPVQNEQHQVEEKSMGESSEGEIVTQEQIMEAEEEYVVYDRDRMTVTSGGSSYVTCRTDRTLQAEDFHTADDALSERTISPMPVIEQAPLNQHHTVKPVPLPAEYNVPPAEARAKVESDILPSPGSSLKPDFNDFRKLLSSMSNNMEQTTYETTTTTSNNESFSSSKNMSASEQLGVNAGINSNSNQSKFQSKIQSVPLIGNRVRQPSIEDHQ